MHLVLVLALAAQLPTLTPRDSAFHALNRLAYGARPGEADSVARFGVIRWIERQLDPDHISDDHIAEREREFKILDYNRADLAGRYRSEEHTSELQSRFDLVCRLLLEKKKKTKKIK